MIFALVENDLVVVLYGEAQARETFEPIDVESETVVFYAEDGTWLEPLLTKPSRYCFFGMFLRQGEYRLQPNPSLPPRVDSFDVAIAEATRMESNPYFSTVAEVEAHVEAQRLESQSRQA